METSTAAASAAPQPQRSESPSRQRTGCFGVFRKFGRFALKRVGRSGKDTRGNTQQAAPSATSAAVDENRENAPPRVEQSDILEVDSREASEFNFEISAPTYFGSPASRDRLAALCARYGLPQEIEAIKSSPTADPAARVTKPSRQRVRLSCHVCNTTFKGDKTCSTCGHERCGDCNRLSITGSTTSSEKVYLVADRRSESSEDVSAKEVDATVYEVKRPVVETAKYNCHKCTVEFASSTNAICENCGHEKCSRCSRQVIHLTEYDETKGKERDPRQNRVYRPAKQRVRHYCDQCSEMFPARTNICHSCSHKRCKSCTRQPTKKRKAATDGVEGQESVKKPASGTQIPIVSESGAHEDITKS